MFYRNKSEKPTEEQCQLGYRAQRLQLPPFVEFATSWYHLWTRLGVLLRSQIYIFGQTLWCQGDMSSWMAKPASWTWWCEESRLINYKREPQSHVSRDQAFNTNLILIISTTRFWPCFDQIIGNLACQLQELSAQTHLRPWALRVRVILKF